YGDLITLLLAFFVVMYAISSVNEGKYRILSEALVAAFRGNPKTLQPIEIGQRKVGENENQVAEPPKVQRDPPGVQRAAPIQTGLPKSLDPVARDLTRLAEEVERAMKDLINANLIVVKRKQFWIEIEIRTDILFPSGSAQLSATAIHTIERLAHV